MLRIVIGRFVFALVFIGTCHSLHAQKIDTLIIHRVDFQERLQGFWLGTCIANWTGLITEMDKIGNIGRVPHHLKV